MAFEDDLPLERDVAGIHLDFKPANVKPPIPIEEALPIARQICEALGALASARS